MQAFVGVRITIAPMRLQKVSGLFCVFLSSGARDVRSRQVVSVGPRDGVEFCQLDFSRRPDEHRPLDVILHKLSDDIMFRFVWITYRNPRIHRRCCNPQEGRSVRAMNLRPYPPG